MSAIEKPQCPICWNNFRPGDRTLEHGAETSHTYHTVLHRFHEACLLQHMAIRRDCPLCQRHIRHIRNTPTPSLAQITQIMLKRLPSIVIQLAIGEGLLLALNGKGPFQRGITWMETLSMSVGVLTTECLGACYEVYRAIHDPQIDITKGIYQKS